MAVESEIEVVVTPLLERELGVSPSMQDVEGWRRRVGVVASSSTVLGALLSRFDGVSVEHKGVRATVRGFGTTVVAGETGVFVLMEVSSGDAHAVVLALDRGHDRVLGVPVAEDATARLEGVLRDTIEQCVGDGPLLQVQFFGVVSEFLQGLPRQLAAAAPPESLGRWVLEHGIPEILGEVCGCDLARGQRLTVHVRGGEASLQAGKDGVWFAPVVEIRRTGARGKRLGETEQQISIGSLGTDTMYEAVPDAARCEAAIAVLRRWKATLGRRIGRLPSSEVRSLMAMDLPWPASPLGLAVEALRHGGSGQEVRSPSRTRGRARAAGRGR